MAKMSTREKPRIELYMYSLNQEFPVKKGHQTFLKRFSELKEDVSGGLVQHTEVESQVFRTDPKLADPKVPPDWSVQWLSNKWIENSANQLDQLSNPVNDPLRRAVLREEDFGGILFDPISDRVFRLNAAGVKLFQEMRKRHVETKAGLRVAAMAGFKQAEVAEFADYLKAAGLWVQV